MKYLNLIIVILLSCKASNTRPPTECKKEDIAEVAKIAGQLTELYGGTAETPTCELLDSLAFEFEIQDESCETDLLNNYAYTISSMTNYDTTAFKQGDTTKLARYIYLTYVYFNTSQTAQKGLNILKPREGKTILIVKFFLMWSNLITLLRGIIMLFS